MDPQHIAHAASSGTMVPEWLLTLIWFVGTSLVTVALGWVIRQLVAIRKLLEQAVVLLVWLRDEHEKEDSKFATVALIPLMERTVRLAHVTMDTMRWLAKRQTGEEPPPSDAGE